MKYLLIFILSLGTLGLKAQSFFKPLPKPGGSAHFGAVALASDSVQNSFRPIAEVSATLSDGTALAGGFGISFQHNKWDVSSDQFVTLWSVAAVGFLSTNANKISGSAGIIAGIPGTNGTIGVGPIYNFTSKTFGLATGVQFKFN